MKRAVFSKGFIWSGLAVALFGTVGEASATNRVHDNWIFGNKCHVEFTPDSTEATGRRFESSVLANADWTSWAESVATLSDPVTGALILYTNGDKVWDATHQEVATGLGGDNSSASTFLIPVPGSYGEYWVVATASGSASTNHATRLDTRSGSVVKVGDTQVLPQATMETLTVVLHENGSDYWLVGHTASHLVVYPVTATGFGTPVLTEVSGAAWGAWGQFSSSADNSKLSLVNTNGKIYLWDFDAATGTVSNQELVTNPLTSPQGMYGGHLSPNGELLYVKRYGSPHTVIQIELATGNTHDFGAQAGSQGGGFRMGPDGRLYHSNNGNNAQLHVFNNPDVVGAGAGLETIALEAGCGANYSLPAFVDHGTGDQDGDGVIDVEDPSPYDPCVPAADSAVCLAGQPTIQIPEDGALINDDSPEIRGRAPAGSSVSIKVDGVELGPVIADGLGRWKVDASGLADGLHEVVVVATVTITPGLEVASLAATSDFTVDTFHPDPTVISPANGTVTANPRPTITGTAEPGSEVTVGILDTNSVELGTATVTAGADGSWSMDLNNDLPDGPYIVSVMSQDEAGNTGGAFSRFTVDTSAFPIAIVSPSGYLPASPTEISGTTEPGVEVTVVISDATGVVETLTVTADANGDWTVNPAALVDGVYTVAATVETAAGVESQDTTSFTVDTVAPETVISAPSGTVDSEVGVVTGTTEPGAEVEVLVDGVVVGTAQADGQGNWSLTLPDALVPGEYVIGAQATDLAGNVGDLTEVNVKVEEPEAPVSVEVSVTSPAEGSTVDGEVVVVAGTATPGAKVEILIDGQKIGEVVADASGNWSFDVVDLGSGAHTVEVVATVGEDEAREEVSFTYTPAEKPIDPDDNELVVSGKGGVDVGCAQVGQSGLLSLAALGLLLRRRRK